MVAKRKMFRATNEMANEKNGAWRKIKIDIQFVCVSRKISSLHKRRRWWWWRRRQRATKQRTRHFAKKEVKRTHKSLNNWYEVKVVWNQRCTLHIIRMENTLNTTHISYIFEYISTYSLNRSTGVRTSVFLFSSFLSFVLFFLSLTRPEIRLLCRLCAWLFRSILFATKWTESRTNNHEKRHNKNQSHHPKIYLAKFFVHTCCRVFVFILLFLFERVCYFFPFCSVTTVFNSVLAWQTQTAKNTHTHRKREKEQNKNEEEIGWDFLTMFIPTQCSFVCFWPMIVYTENRFIYIGCSIVRYLNAAAAAFFAIHNHIYLFDSG